MGRSTQGQPVRTLEPPAARGIALSRVWPFAAICFPVAQATALPLSSVDLAYQVRAGQMMLELGRVLRVDPWTFSAGGDWLNQQWGAGFLFGSTFELAGWLGLAALRALLAGACLALVFLACRARGASRRAAAGWVLLAAASWPFVLRAQSLGVVSVTAFVWLLAGRGPHPRRLWIAVPLMLVWVNTHGSFVLAFPLMGWALLEPMGPDPASRREDRRRILALASACLAITAVTPFGPTVWTYVRDVATSEPIRRLVEEWQPPSLETYGGIVFFASAAFAACVLARRGVTAGWPTLAVLGFFFLLGLTSLRGAVWWGVLAPVALAGPSPPGAPVRPDPVNRANVGIAAAFVGLVAISLIRWIPHAGAAAPDGLVRFAPPEITRELRSRLGPGDRLFAAQEWGSWFELELPEPNLFVDSRFELIPDTAWADYEVVAAAGPDWEPVLDRLKVDIVVASRDRQPELVRALGGSTTWIVAYEDEDGIIAVRAPDVG